MFTVLLLLSLVWQMRAHAGRTGDGWSLHPERAGWLLAAVALLPLNIFLEAAKWRILAGTIMRLSFAQSLASVLGGIAASMVTPNRLGEYPGRIAFLSGHRRSARLLSISVMGAASQMLAVLFFGMVGLVYYSFQSGRLYALLALAGTAMITGAVALFFARFEDWAHRLEGNRLFRRLRLYARALRATTGRERARVLGFSLLRYATFSAQLLLMLRWQGIAPAWGPGILLCFLFFYTLAVVPTIALAELGVRGAIAVFLFGTFAPHGEAPILTATAALWVLNLAFPSLAGLALLWRRRAGFAGLTESKAATEKAERHLQL